MPVIKELLNQRCEVWIAASGAQKVVLQKEFPLLRIVEIPGYDVKYGGDRGRTIARLTLSVPKILIRIKQENRWLGRFLTTEKPDIVISDNRYGLHAPGLFSVFMTHQLRIRTPFGRRADDWLQKIHYRAIRAFSRCWIPDTQGSPSLAGSLSHPGYLPSIPTRYIGWLSRFAAPRTAHNETAAASEIAAAPEIAAASGFTLPVGAPASPSGLSPLRPPFLLVLLSGPEPQRTLLEQKILHQAELSPLPITLVRGLPAATPDTPSPAVSPPDVSSPDVSSPDVSSPDASQPYLRSPDPGSPIAPRHITRWQAPNITVYDHLPTSELAALIGSAEFVLSRAGYSTIMDLAQLKKKAIFIPTPGQTEQEYLGTWLSDQHLALCISQSDLSLPAALTAARAYPWSEWTTPGTTH